MSDDLDTARQREIARIRAEYARRGREVPADRYSLENPGHRFLHHSQNRAFNTALARGNLLPLAGKRLLEIGCGSGRWLAHFAHLGIRPSDLIGIDLDFHRLHAARASTSRSAPGGALVCADASYLPWGDHRFDLVLQSTVMTSILDPGLRIAVAAEMVRVTRPGGALLWYDFRVDNPRNPHVRGVPRRELLRLFSGCQVDVQRTTLAPPIARLLAPHAPTLARLLDRSHIFATHDLAVIRPPG